MSFVSRNHINNIPNSTNILYQTFDIFLQIKRYIKRKSSLRYKISYFQDVSLILNIEFPNAQMLKDILDLY